MIGKLTFAAEPVRVLFEQGQALMARHWDEIALWKADFAMLPDYEHYLALERVGRTALYTARAADGRLVGYAGFIISAMGHYKHKRIAACDIIYLAEECRQGLAAGARYLRFIEFCDSDLQAAHCVDRIVHRVKLGHDFGRVFERAGYVETERTFEKVPR